MVRRWEKLVASGPSTLTNVPSIWMISLTGAAPRLLRARARDATPSPDGRRVVFTSQDRSEIWVMGARGGDSRKVVAGPGEDTFPLTFWSPDGRRIGFQRRHFSPEHHGAAQGVFDRFYELSYESVELITGKVTARVPDIGMSSAAALPDGRILFLRYFPPFTDSADQLWGVKTNLATGAFAGTPQKIMTPVGQYEPTLTG